MRAPYAVAPGFAWDLFMRIRWLGSWTILLALGGVSIGAGASAGENWPQWRGPGGRGVGEHPGLPVTWSATENVRWKRDLPGLGWSSPIVWDGKVFVTTVESQGEIEKPIKGLYFGGERKTPSTDLHRWKVLCLDLASGKIMWEQVAHRGPPPSTRHVKNSYASETPVTDGQRVYAYFGNLGLFCYDLNGAPLWEKLFDPKPTQLGWGPAASPALHDGKIFVLNDNEEGSYLTSLDAATGAELWRVPRDESSNWASPFVWQNSLRTELVTCGKNKVRSYDLDGNLLYEFGGMSVISIPTPQAVGDLLYVSSGYVLDLRRRPVYAVRPGASGDISLADDADSNEYIVWRQPYAGPYNPSPLVHDGRLWVLFDRGFIASHDAATGAEIIAQKRLTGAESFTSSPWAYRDRVFCLNEDGKTYVLDAKAKDLVIEAENLLAEDDICLATPAIVGDMLLIRTSARLYCIQNRAEAK
jgi:outer membrane protein assembly factor BamB